MIFIGIEQQRQFGEYLDYYPECPKPLVEGLQKNEDFRHFKMIIKYCDLDWALT